MKRKRKEAIINNTHQVDKLNNKWNSFKKVELKVNSVRDLMPLEVVAVYLILIGLIHPVQQHLIYHLMRINGLRDHLCHNCMIPMLLKIHSNCNNN
jgi:hypothetical protein